MYNFNVKYFFIFFVIFLVNYGNFVMYFVFEMNFIFFNFSLNLDLKNFK